MSLRLQVNLIITSLLTLFASVLIGVQIDNTRRSVHEEIVAANVVAGQFLSRMQWIYRTDGLYGIADFLKQMGRIRANDIELHDEFDKVIYKSPPATYKLGREAPSWYNTIVAPPIEVKEIQLPNGKLILQANTSRAVLDGWDDLHLMLWAVLTGFVLTNLLVYALMGRALKPLHQLAQSLQLMAHGKYSTRLPMLRGSEGRQISSAFNQMAQSVQDSIEAKRQAQAATLALAENRELTQMIQERIEQERGAISRELHDELGQQVTAIKSLSLGIARRAENSDATIENSARMVMDCADQIYDGMHRMIAKLRPFALDHFGLDEALIDFLADCRLQHPELVIEATIPASVRKLDDTLATAIYRIVQEAVNNTLRHAQAKHLSVSLTLEAQGLQIDLIDDGCGLVEQFTKHGHFGISGMRERVHAFGGRFELRQSQPCGVWVHASFPLLHKDTQNDA